MGTRKPAVKWDCGQCEALSHACLVSSTHSLEWAHLAPWKCSKGGMKKRACPKSSELDEGRREVAMSAKNWLYWTKDSPWKRRKWNEKNQLGISESTSKSHETTVLVNNLKSSKRRAKVMVNNRLSEIRLEMEYFLESTGLSCWLITKFLSSRRVVWGDPGLSWGADPPSSVQQPLF